MDQLNDRKDNYYEPVHKVKDRTEFLEVFSKYIPKFEYEPLDLNQYSRDDLAGSGICYC